MREQMNITTSVLNSGSGSSVRVMCKDIEDVLWMRDVEDLLPEQETRLWRIQLSNHDSLVDGLLQILSDDEKVRACAYHHVKDKNRYVICRAALRLLLSRQMKQQASLLKFGYTADRKPFLKGDGISSLQFNVTHSGDFGLITISKRPVGVDMEKIDKLRHYGAIADNFFNRAEINSIENDVNPDIAFYKLWTRKEALLKAIGKGIINNLWALPVLNGINEIDAALLGTSIDWTVSTFMVDHDHIASIAVNGNIDFRTIELKEFI